MEGRAVGIVCAGAAALAVCVASAAVTQQSGQWALPGGKPALVSRLSLTGGGDLVVSQYARGSKDPIAPCVSQPLTHTSAAPCYALSEGEPVHVILVRDDFASFAHVHPEPIKQTCVRCAPGAQKTGTYTIHVSLEPRHRYYAYVASRVSGLPDQAYRFVLQPATHPAHVTATTIKTSAKTTAGPYDVALDQPKVRAGKAQILNADITHKPHAPGVAPFHVASLHAILVNTSSLAYEHVDGAVDRGICCEYALRVPALPKGLYRMWLQFDDGNATYTAPFTFAAQ